MEHPFATSLNDTLEIGTRFESGKFQVWVFSTTYETVLCMHLSLH